VTGARRSVALVTAPGVIEEWLEPLGVSLEAFRDELSGGWMFNYVEALKTVDVDTVIVCFSEWVSRPERFENRPTGATIWMIPPGRARATAQRWLAEEPLRGARDPRSLLRGVRIHAAPYGLTPLRPLVRVLRNERCDAVLSQDYDSQRFDACVLAGRMRSIPVFASFQGGGFRASVFGDALRPLSLRAAAGLIVPAREEAERVRARYRLPEDKCARIPNPLDVTAWRAIPQGDAREVLGIPAGARVALTHGRVDIDDKGLDTLLEAWSRIVAARSDADLRLLLVGRGDDSARVRELLGSGRYGGAELVDEFIVDREALIRYLSAADVFAFAGRYEGFPVAPTEAMACGLPVVATDASGIPDLFEDGEASGGVVVPRDDPAVLAAALGRVLDEEELGRELGRRARARVERHCSLESVGRQLDEFMTSRGMRSA
jgi:glycosyltransferase involved in cell wall biosynthesis